MSNNLVGECARLRIGLLAVTASLGAFGLTDARAQDYSPGPYYPPGPYYAGRDYGPVPYGPSAYAPWERSGYSASPSRSAPPTTGYPAGPYVGGPYAGGYYRPGYGPTPSSAYDPYAADRRAVPGSQPAPYQAAAQPSTGIGAGQAPRFASPATGRFLSGSGFSAGATLATQGKPPLLSRRMSQAASAYVEYMTRASDISGRFTGGSDVARELKVGVAYEPRQFEEGATAYVAMLALQDPGFVSGVRSVWGGESRRGQSIAASLLADPTSALTFSGAQLAAARAGGALRRQGDRLMLAGMRVKQAAYDVQHAVWSKAAIIEPQSRLAGVKALSSTRSSARDGNDPVLQRALAESDTQVSGGASPLISRGLALAALTVMGQDSEAPATLGAEEKGADCLKMAKLNLFQCLAVAGPHYEDIFCLGQHAMMDTAQCVISGSGVSRPLVTASAAAQAGYGAARTSAAPRSYWAGQGGKAVDPATR